MHEVTARLYERTKPYRVVRSQRPDHIETPGPGQESVWDYPRPPRLEPVAAVVRVEADGQLIAETTDAMRVCETAGAPVYYIPPPAIADGFLEPSTSNPSVCEWKGPARYWDVRHGGTLTRDAGWSYPDPFPGFEEIRDFVGFYPAKVACFVGGERVEPQPGGFYGGWVTANLVGPIKGAPGSEGW